MRLPILLLLANTLLAQPAYDLLLKGGHVIDPKNKISAVRDVAIHDGFIAAVDSDIPADKARKVVEVAGLYVVPGLIDLHAHVYAGSEGKGLAGGRFDAADRPVGEPAACGQRAERLRPDAAAVGRIEEGDVAGCAGRRRAS